MKFSQQWSIHIPTPHFGACWGFTFNPMWSHACVPKFGTDWSASGILSLRKIPQVSVLPAGEASLSYQVYQMHNSGLPFPSRACLCLPLYSCLTPALFIPGSSSQASHKSLPSSSILKQIVLLSLAITLASSTAPTAPCCCACWGRCLCTFWHLEQACHGVPVSWEVSAWRGAVVLYGESLRWAQGTSQNYAQRSHSFRWITFIKLFLIGVKNGKLLRKKKGFEITWWQKITAPSTRDLWQCVGSGAAPESRDSLKLRPFTGRDTLSSLKGFDVSVYFFFFLLIFFLNSLSVKYW